MKDIQTGPIGAGSMGKAYAVALKNVPLVFANEPAITKRAAEFGLAGD